MIRFSFAVCFVYFFKRFRLIGYRGIGTKKPLCAFWYQFTIRWLMHRLKELRKFIFFQISSYSLPVAFFLSGFSSSSSSLEKISGRKESRMITIKVPQMAKMPVLVRIFMLM